MASLKLKPGRRARVLRGHAWIYATEVQALPDATHDGGTMEARDGEGRFLGVGIVNTRSQIVWRRISREKVELDARWLGEKLAKAVQRREPRAARRLVWSEADGLPGLVVDQFGSQVVFQTLTLAMDRWQEVIAKWLSQLPGVRTVLARNDAPVRELEGLEREVKVWHGEPAEEWVRVGEIDFCINVSGGNKTGFYLDQQENYQHVAAWAGGRRVLDTFTNQGGFALHAARAGAREVRAVESSAPALALARKNSERAGLQVDWVEANVFDYFHQRRGEKWDLIILDPPSFSKSRSGLAGALRGYKELNLRALQALDPGGLLATFTCSHHVTAEEFREVVAAAAHDARRDVRVRAFLRQASDHPVLLGVPETSYLHGWLLEVEA